MIKIFCQKKGNETNKKICSCGALDTVIEEIAEGVWFAINNIAEEMQIENDMLYDAIVKEIVTIRTK